MNMSEMAEVTEEQTSDETPLPAPAETGSIFCGLPQELVDKLHPAKIRMILLYLTGQYSNKKIATIVGVSSNTISSWLIDPTVQTVIKEIQSREFAVIEGNLKALQHKAVTTMNELLDSCMDNVRYSAAKDLLDRGGHKPQQSIKVDKTVTTVEQQLASLAEFTIEDDEVIDINIDDFIGADV